MGLIHKEFQGSRDGTSESVGSRESRFESGHHVLTQDECRLMAPSHGSLERTRDVKVHSTPSNLTIWPLRGGRRSRRPSAAVCWADSFSDSHPHSYRRAPFSAARLRSSWCVSLLSLFSYMTDAR